MKQTTESAHSFVKWSDNEQIIYDFNGIQVIRGCSGDIETVASQWLDGSLKDSGDSCASHDHGHTCNHWWDSIQS